MLYCENTPNFFRKFLRLMLSCLTNYLKLNYLWNSKAKPISYPEKCRHSTNILFSHLISIISNKKCKCLKQRKYSQAMLQLSNITQSISFGVTNFMYKMMIKFAYYKIAWLCSVNNIPLQFTAKYPTNDKKTIEIL